VNAPVPLAASPVAEAGVGAGAVEAPLVRVRGARSEETTAPIAREVPVAFEYNGVSHAVMLATPCDLEDFALGFSLSEGIVDAASDLYGVEVHEQDAGITLAIEVAARAFVRLKEKRRTLAGRTGCGICGAESLAQVLRPLPALAGRGPAIDAAALAHAHAQLAAAPPRARARGATHGAAWCTPDGRIVAAREDVGRHNALDKLIGALARAHADTSEGFALITSRASVEMVQKSATAGIALLAAVSAPTALAVRNADACGQTLIGFARGADFSIYTHPQRVRL
jgi:FdhD protein